MSIDVIRIMSHEIHVIHEIASIQVTKHQTHYRRERTKFVKHILCNCDNVCAISFVRLQCANVSHYGYLGNSEPSDSSTQNPSAGHFPGNQCWKSLWTMSVQAIGDVSAAIVVRFDAWCMCRYLFFFSSQNWSTWILRKNFSCFPRSWQAVSTKHSYYVKWHKSFSPQLFRCLSLTYRPKLPNAHSLTPSHMLIGLRTACIFRL